MPLLTELHRALEVAHYARRHRADVFVMALADGVVIDDVLLDLKLIHAHAVRMVVVTTERDARSPLVGQARAEGIPLELLEAGEEAPVRAATARGAIPVVGVTGSRRPVGPVERSAASLARDLGARRLLLVRPADETQPTTRPHLTVDEARTLAGEDPLWRLVIDAVADHAGLPGVVLVPGAPGTVYAEMFTHQGAGLLVGDPVVERIRPARAGDAPDLELLLRAEVERGLIRAIPPHDVSRTAHQHLVYTIDGFVVATARLRPYGNWAELSRFATMPRYRGRGRARQLGEALVKRARDMGYEGIFALSIDARMWRFFESLGMAPVERTELPEAWQAGYDFCRPSRAFSRTV